MKNLKKKPKSYDIRNLKDDLEIITTAIVVIVAIIPSILIQNWLRNFNE